MSKDVDDRQIFSCTGKIVLNNTCEENRINFQYKPLKNAITTYESYNARFLDVFGHKLMANCNFNNCTDFYRRFRDQTI